LGSCINNGIAYCFLKQSGTHELHTWSFNYRTGEETDRYEVMDMLKERMIAQISNGSYFLYCTLKKKTKDIAVYDFIGGSAFNVIRYSSDTVWDDLTHSDGLTRDFNFTTVPADADCSVDVASCLNKLYVAGDSLYLVSNKQKGITDIYSFNLRAKNSFTQENLSPGFENGNNSFRFC
jgi:hypothetical protein